MQFRPNNPISPKKRKENRHQRPHFSLSMATTLLVVLLGAGAIYGFQHRDGRSAQKVSLLDPIEAKIGIHHQEYGSVERVRLQRSEIPQLNLNALSYAELFCDTNATQRIAAVNNGLKNPELVTDLDGCKELLRIGSNELYVVDTMYFSKPYLVPEAVVLMEMIGERFQEVMKEHYPDYQHVRPIITSALRSNQDVEKLRRRNRNASDSSCHIFGTTVDISYTRFLTDDGNYAMEYFLKPMLALTLYELRHEGLIYVKHERHQACFHLTLRTTNYQGNGRSEKRQYTQPHRWSNKDAGHLALRAKPEPTTVTTSNPPASKPSKSTVRKSHKKSNTNHQKTTPQSNNNSKHKKTGSTSNSRYQVEANRSSHHQESNDPRAEKLYGGLIDDDSYIVH